AARQALRFSSDGLATHFSAACSAAAAFGGGLAPATARTHWHAHHTASRLGRPYASTRTASGKWLLPMSRSRYCFGGSRSSRSFLASASRVNRRQISAAVLAVT